MGIRIQCQNGHKLHVKSFLAGKRAVCPNCGVKILIPSDLEDKTNSRESGMHLAGADATGAGADATGAWRSAEVSPRMRGEKDGPSPPAPPTVLPQEAGSNRLDATPQAPWYVRPPTGGQYGPASAEVLRNWIAEGRVTADCLVWCEGWDQWRTAELLLRSERGRAIEPPAVVTPPTTGVRPASAEIQIDTGIRPNARTSRRKRALVLVYLLLMVCLLLLVPLYLVTLGR